MIQREVARVENRNAERGIVLDRALLAGLDQEAVIGGDRRQRQRRNRPG